MGRDGGANGCSQGASPRRQGGACCVPGQRAQHSSHRGHSRRRAGWMPPAARTRGPHQKQLLALGVKVAKLGGHAAQLRQLLEQAAARGASAGGAVTIPQLLSCWPHGRCMLTCTDSCAASAFLQHSVRPLSRGPRLQDPGSAASTSMPLAAAVARLTRSPPAGKSPTVAGKGQAANAPWLKASRGSQSALPASNRAHLKQRAALKATCPELLPPRLLPLPPDAPPPRR